MYPVEIACPRVKIRNFALSDLPDVFTYASDADATKFMSWPAPVVKEDSLPFLTEAVDSAREVERRKYELAVELNGVVVGAGALRVNAVMHHEAELGYILRRDLWGQGITTEVATHLVAFGFGTLGLHRIMSFHDVDNIASKRVMDKVGLQYEGRLRDQMKNRAGEYRDSDLQSILSTDPQAV